MTNKNDTRDELKAKIAKIYVDSHTPWPDMKPIDWPDTFATKIVPLVDSELIKKLESLKEEMKMHTVPEGQHLITRSYLNNSIDFIIASLRKGKESV